MAVKSCSGSTAVQLIPPDAWSLDAPGLKVGDLTWSQRTWLGVVLVLDLALALAPAMIGIWVLLS